MTDPTLRHIPRFDYGSTSLTLTYPVTRWLPGARTNGIVKKSADGTPGAVVDLRKYTLAMTLRFMETEWVDVSAFIHFAQTGASFEWFHGEDNDDIPASFTCTLGSPRMTQGVRPSRDGSLPWMMTLPIVLEGDDIWYIEYFGTSEIPEIDHVVFTHHIDVSILDDTLGLDDTTTASAILYDEDDNVLDPNDHPIVWSSSDVSVATVDPDTGVVTAVDSGTCDIIATSDGITGSVSVTVAAVPALIATGGTIFYEDTFVYHVFDASADFVISSGSSFVDILIVAGGGGGGASQDRTGGGGGAGGVKYFTGVPLTPGTYPAVVGGGGAGGKVTPSASNGANGSNSSFNGQTATGGGKGAGWGSSKYFATAGGSGGGCNHSDNFPGAATPSGQGSAGGGIGYNSGSGSGVFTGSGGGGAGGAGVAGTNLTAGRGGHGVSYDITGVATYYGGGGGGSAGNYGGQSVPGGVGGDGGGGAGAMAQAVAVHGTNGTAGLGGGGGAGARAGGNGGDGGRGVVIIRYPMI